MRRSHVLAFLALSATPLLAQQTFIVSAGGDIQTTIDGATAGDTIYVRAGTYSRFVVDRGLNVLGEGSDDVVIIAGSNPVSCAAPNGARAMRVTGIPVGETAVIAGMRFQSGFTGATMSSICEDIAVSVDNNSGTVLLQDLEVDSVVGALSVRTSNQLYLDGCELRRTVPTSIWEAIPDVTMEVLDSTVWIANSSVRGGQAEGNLIAAAGRPGLHVENSDLVVADSEILGGSGIDAQGFMCGMFGASDIDGGPALVTGLNANVTLTGARTLVRGGDGAQVDSTCATDGGVGVDARVSPVLWTAGVVVEGGDHLRAPSTPGQLTAPAFLGSVQAVGIRALTLRTERIAAGTFRFRTQGAPNGIVGLWSALGSRAPLSLPAIQGALALDGTAQLVALATADTNGNAVPGVTIIPTPLPQSLYGTILHLQALQVGVGSPVLSNLTVLPEQL